MKMSDKDFDQLFNSKLGDMEMEPSANVWSNITAELDGKKKDKKAGLPFMKIAAGIVILMAVGLFFIRPEHQKIQLTASATKEPVELSESSTTTNTSVSVQPEPTDSQSTTVAEVIKPSVKHRESQRVERFEMAIAKSVDTVKTQPQYVAKVTEPVNQNTTNNVRVAANTSTAGLLPETTNTFSPKATITEPSKINTIPVIAAKTNTEKITAEPAKRKRIHSLGDLLNVVIAKVDKREDKLIEFTNNSDDDTFNVTGVNLGLLHAKKEK